jgi:ssDNA-binding Zn-finger/Zn-ribbon topoisomerase 1
VLVVRTNKREGNHFWGCSNFPKCRYTRPKV